MHIPCVLLLVKQWDDKLPLVTIHCPSILLLTIILTMIIIIINVIIMIVVIITIVSTLLIYRAHLNPIPMSIPWEEAGRRRQVPHIDARPARHHQDDDDDKNGDDENLRWNFYPLLDASTRSAVGCQDTWKSTSGGKFLQKKFLSCISR